MTETDPKQTASPSLSSLYLNLLLSQSSPPPSPLSVSVSPCYFSLPCVVHPSSAFSPNVPTEPDLMDDPLLWRLGSPWGPSPSSVGIRVQRSDRASSGRRLPLSVSVCIADIRGICIEGWQDVSAKRSLMAGNGQSTSLSPCPVVSPSAQAACAHTVAEGLRWDQMCCGDVILFLLQALQMLHLLKSNTK